MNLKSFVFLTAILLGVCLALFPAGFASAQSDQTIILSSSAQVAAVLINADVLKSFTAGTGIKVDMEVTSSDAAVGRLAAGLSDLALVAQRLEYRYKDHGFVEQPFLKDALAIISNAQTSADSLTDHQIRDLFAGKLNNWTDVGNGDRPVVVVIPAKETALYRNFSRMAMEGEDVDWDIMTASSTEVNEVARRIVGAISFVNQSSVQGKPQGAKVIKVNGLDTKSEGYPYVQVFSIVTKGRPEGPVKAFIDFLLNEETIGKMTSFGVQAYKE